MPWFIVIVDIRADDECSLLLLADVIERSVKRNPDRRSLISIDVRVPLSDTADITRLINVPEILDVHVNESKKKSTLERRLLGLRFLGLTI